MADANGRKFDAQIKVHSWFAQHGQSCNGQTPAWVVKQLHADTGVRLTGSTAKRHCQSRGITLVSRAADVDVRAVVDMQRIQCMLEALCAHFNIVITDNGEDAE